MFLKSWRKSVVYQLDFSSCLGGKKDKLVKLIHYQEIRSEKQILLYLVAAFYSRRIIL